MRQNKQTQWKHSESHWEHVKNTSVCQNADMISGLDSHLHGI